MEEEKKATVGDVSRRGYGVFGGAKLRPTLDRWLNAETALESDRV